MLWIRILVVTPLVLVIAVLLLSFLTLQTVFAGAHAPSHGASVSR